MQPSEPVGRSVSLCLSRGWTGRIQRRRRGHSSKSCSVLMKPDDRLPTSFLTRLSSTVMEKGQRRLHKDFIVLKLTLGLDDCCISLTVAAAWNCGTALSPFLF